MVYCDNSCLVKLYVREADSLEAIQLVEKCHGDSILFTKFQQLEVTAAIEGKVFRGEIEEEEAGAAFNELAAHLELGYLDRPRIDWEEVFASGIELASQTVRKSGNRSLDLLHIAIAKELGCKTLLTYDKRQAEVAVSIGFEVLPS